LLVELNRRTGCGRVTLRRFDRSDLFALIDTVTGTSPPEPFVEGLLRRTGGNPFFAAEIVRCLFSQERSGTVGRWWDRGPIGVPSGVRNFLRSRLADMKETTRQLLCSVAVIGDEADVSLVGAAMRLGDDDLVAALEEAIGAGLLVDVGNAWSATCAFAHSLVRDAVYDDIPFIRRRRLQQGVAQTLLDRAEPKQTSAPGVHPALGASRRWHDGVLEPDADASRTVARPTELLTAREREVLRLIAEGLSDREIARRLVISPHTVHRHVANVRTKLGQPSRAAAVAHAVRQKII
jgi:DNA-binding NarL/FixJ family response regulator